jgi:hypothetical protein
MKKLLIVLLAFTLASCSALAPVPQPTSVPPPAQVVVQTVVVMITPTPLPPTPIPSVTLAPTSTPLPPTDVPASVPTTAAQPTAGSTSTGGPLTLPNTSGGGVFINMSVSGDYFSLRCYPKELTFNVTAADLHIVSVEFYYRIQDKNSVDISDWINGGLMEPDKQGNFSFVLKAESINPDWRRTQTSYDFQFIGVNKTGEVVGRTERIIKLINYSNDCP